MIRFNTYHDRFGVQKQRIEKTTEWQGTNTKNLSKILKHLLFNRFLSFFFCVCFCVLCVRYTFVSVEMMSIRITYELLNEVNWKYLIPRPINLVFDRACVCMCVCMYFFNHLWQAEEARKMYLQNCREHIGLRKKPELEDMLLKSLPYNHVPPRYCRTSVMIDHFKFINGLRRYLFNRVKTYRQMDLQW